jgi:D-lactate dehydrogenase
MFNKSFSLMKKELFINTARGTVVNTEDLIDALKMGNIGAAGLDVYEKKEQFSTTLLKNWEIIYTLYFAPSNVLITGHQGFLTNEALEELREPLL